MVLRLEHVEDVGPEGLGGLDDVGTGGIAFAGGGEGGRGLVDLDASFDEGVDELDGRRKVGLGGGEDVAAGIAEIGLLHGRVESGGGGGSLGTRGAGGGLVLRD